MTLDHAKIIFHNCFADFLAAKKKSERVVLLTTKAETGLYDFTFNQDDILLFGRESAGVPDGVHQAADARLRIPMPPGFRSLNLAVSAAIAVSEALRQTAVDSININSVL